MKTALYRTEDGNIRTMKRSDYASKKEFATDLRMNGFRVLNIWNGDASEDEIQHWLSYNRKK